MFDEAWDQKLSRDLEEKDFAALAVEASKASHDPSRQVGAIIVDGAGNVVSKGANRPPVALGLTPHASHVAIQADSNWKYFVLEHAERNAIHEAMQAGANITGASMYGTLFPCADCARAIVSAGIKRLVVPVPAPGSDRDEKWGTHFRYAREIFRLAGVRVEFYPIDISG